MKIMFRSLIAFLVLALVTGAGAVTFPGNGDAGFGGPIGTGSLTLTDDGTNISGTITRGTGSLNDYLVIYVDSVPGGFTDTAAFADNFDDFHRAISGFDGAGNRSVLTHPPGFTADFAVAINANFGGLWRLTNGGSLSLPFVTSVNVSPTGNPNAASYTFSFPVSAIGLTPGNGGTFKLVGTYVSGTGFRSTEAVAGNVSGVQGWNPFSVSATTNYSVSRPSFLVLNHFGSTNGAVAKCRGGLVSAGAMLYGTTFFGGTSDQGTIFKIGTNGSNFAIIKHFAGGTDGASPYAGLTLVGNTLYGTTAFGGGADLGTVFKVNVDGSGYTILKHFTGLADGGVPEAGLIEAGGTLYGVTKNGGSADFGVIFKLSTNGTSFTVLKEFTGADGSRPKSRLVQSENTLYGTTSAGGNADVGTVFKLNTDGTGFTVLRHFAGTPDGSEPEGQLVLAGEVLYGTTQTGGPRNPLGGTIFKVNTDGTGYAVLKAFTDAADGWNVRGGLTLDAGFLYGTAHSGGADDAGVILGLSTNGLVEVLLHDFVPATEGLGPMDLTLAGGTLYGTTFNGGPFDSGAVIRQDVPAPGNFRVFGQVVPGNSIRLPATNVLVVEPVNLSGGATYQWTKKSGKDQFHILAPTNAPTTVIFDWAGTYVLSLKTVQGASVVERLLTVTVEANPDGTFQNLHKFLTGPLATNASPFLTRFPSTATDAARYYAAIDPFNQKTTMNGWKTANGITTAPIPATTTNFSGVAAATYFNSLDLGFGRRMIMKGTPGGEWAYAVANYPSVEEAIADTNKIATVTMDYSAVLPGGPRFTKFYIYDGNDNRVASANLDGGGEKYLPGLCVVCHGGTTGTIAPGDSGNVGAQFLPFDLKVALDYSSQSNFTRAAQEPVFKQMNQGVLDIVQSIASNTPTTGCQTIIDLIQGWYGPGFTRTTQNDNYTPAGWQDLSATNILSLAGQSYLYHNVVAPDCRSCHETRVPVRGALDFLSFTNWNSLRLNISNAVYAGLDLAAPIQVLDPNLPVSMPMARRTFQRFWNSIEPRPHAEILRDYLRDTLDTYNLVPPPATVTSLVDNAPGSLRQVVTEALPGTTVYFAPELAGQTLLLTQGEILLNKSVTLDASGLGNVITIDGNQNGRIFNITGNAIVSLDSLVLTNGYLLTTANNVPHAADGGAILNAGNLTLTRCTVVGNGVEGNVGSNGATGSPSLPAQAGGAGNSANGGGIFNEGVLTLNQCTLAANRARGGTGGLGGVGAISGLFVNGATGGAGGNASGGGLYNSGSVTLNQCTLATNVVAGGAGGAGGWVWPGNGAQAGNGGSGGTGSGGAIYSTTGALAINQCTVVDHAATAGGGGLGGDPNGAPGGSGTTASAVFSETGTPAIYNSIVAANLPSNIAGSFTTNGLNLLTGDPQLLPLANYGGPTPTKPPQLGAGAINGCVSGTTFTNDQRGLPRLVGAFADIGAVELSSLELFISSRPLRWAVGNSNWTATAFTWLDSVANVLASYTPGQGVIFDDVASGASPVFVTNTLSITTGGIMFSNTSKDYVLTGAGVFSNNVPISKFGSGTVTIASTNPLYGGRFTLAQGTLALPAGAALGSAASGALLICSNTTAVALGSSGNTTPVVPVLIGAGANVTNTANALGTGFNGDITSADSSGSINANSSITYGGNFQGFTGTLRVNSGTTRFSKGANGATDLGSSNAVFIVNSSAPGLRPRNQNTVVHLGALSGAGTLSGSQTTTSANTTTFSIGALNQSTTFGGLFLDNLTPTTNVAIVKVGSGTLTLTGNSPNSGATTVNAGALILTTSGSLSNSAVTVNNGATNGVTIASAGGSTTVSNFTCAAGTTYLKFDFGTNAPSISVAPLQVRGNLAVNGTLNLMVSGDSFPPGTYPLVSYGGTLSGAVPATLFAFSAETHQQLINDTGTKRILLQVTSPVTFMVLNTNNQGAGSLRQAVADSRRGDTILFTNTLSGQTIVLSNGAIALTRSSVIDASALPAGITISGNHTNPIFNISSGATNLLVGLTLRDGFNATTNGGAINNSGVLTAQRCTFAGNQSLFDGGAIGMEVGGAANASATFVECTFIGNAALRVGFSRGGAIFSGARNTASVSLNLVGCTIISNSVSGVGGGIANQAFDVGSTAPVKLENCTFTGNTAQYGAGALYEFTKTPADPGCSLVHCTVAENTGNFGGGLLNDGKISVTNSIVAGNSSTNSPDIIQNLGFLQLGGTNLIGNLTNSGLTGSVALITGNAVLAPVGDYGGPTQTMPPLPGSPAIDAGVATALATDQRGFTRTVGAAVDIGAVEASLSFAWWRFEAGPANANVNHSAATGVFSPDVPDSSTNGNELSIWSTGGGTGYAYRSDVPWSTVPSEGVTNRFSVQNTGGFPAMFTSSNAPFASITPLAWTIEVTFKPENGGFRTFVGRDSQGTVGSDPSLAALYFQAQPDNSLAIKYADVTGVFHQAISATNLIKGYTAPNTAAGFWQSAVAVCDGTTLSLYYKNITAGNPNFTLVAQTNLTGSSADLRLSAGAGAGSDWFHGVWSVGRGLYAGGHTDRAKGLIDEVRFSGRALSPSRFLSTPIVILATNSPVLTGPTTLGNGAFQFSFISAPGASLTVWASTNVALPFAQWTNLGAPVESPAGTFTFTDPQATNSPQRFYRVSSP